jgi:DNA-directed RNA polymerase subunit RPC12/RpoP
MSNIISYDDFDKNADVTCPKCGWKGTSKDHISIYDRLLDVTCPKCEEIILIASWEPEYKKSPK